MHIGSKDHEKIRVLQNGMYLSIQNLDRFPPLNMLAFVVMLFTAVFHTNAFHSVI